MIEKNGRIHETPEDNLFINEINGVRVTRSFVKNSKKTYRDLIREYLNIVIDKELNN